MAQSIDIRVNIVRITFNFFLPHFAYYMKQRVKKEPKLRTKEGERERVAKIYDLHLRTSSRFRRYDVQTTSPISINASNLMTPGCRRPTFHIYNGIN